MEIVDAESADEVVLAKMAAGSEFRAGYREFSTFRQHYANAQVPRDCLSPPDAESMAAYQARLSDELTTSMRIGTEVSITRRQVSAVRMDVAVSLGAGRVPVPAQVIDSAFLASSIVRCDPGGRWAVVSKSPTRHAWTLDQAVSDAIAISREMRRAAA